MLLALRSLYEVSTEVIPDVDSFSSAPTFGNIGLLLRLGVDSASSAPVFGVAGLLLRLGADAIPSSVAFGAVSSFNQAPFGAQPIVSEPSFGTPVLVVRMPPPVWKPKRKRHRRR